MEKKMPKTMPSHLRDVTKTRVDLDAILIQEIGQFGAHQLKTMLLAILVVMFATWAAIEYVFTTARINTRCLIPECETAEQTEFAPEWILNAVPGDFGYLDKCHRFSNATIRDEIVEGTCPATLFNRTEVITCEQHVYENNETIVYDFDLACDEWRRTLIGSVRTFGTLVALPITGYISDRWGRRTALVFNAINTACIGSLRYFADTYIGFVISELVQAIVGSGMFSCVYILVLEVMGPKYRVLGGVTMNFASSLGQISIGLIAWAVPTWRQLTIALFLPQLLTVSYLWLMTESVRWYLSKGQYDDAEKVLRNIARTNKKQLSATSLQLLRDTSEEEKKKAAQSKLERATEPWLIIQVFRHKSILVRCAVSPIWWITYTLIYYGLSVNAVNLTGHKYLNYVAVSAAEVPGHFTAYVLMSRIGRKFVLAGAFWVCAACQLGYILMPDGLVGMSLALYLIGKYSSAVVMTTIYVYTNELYPTRYRHRLFAFSSMMGRIGSILAPLTPALGEAVWEYLPFALFGGMSLLSGLLVLATPETLGTTLPDTMEEASSIGKKART